MTDHILYRIPWESSSAHPYLYGSSIRYLPNGNVRFLNRMMPSGYPINEWTSFTNFQIDRHEPQLPILQEGRTYRFRAWFFEQPSGAVFLRFDFYDQQGNRLEYQIFDEKEGAFIAPENTFRYTLQLVQGGSEKLMFYYMELFAEDAWIFWKVGNPDKDSKVLNLVIPEIRGRMAFVPDNILKMEMSNVTAISPGMDSLPLNMQIHTMETVIAGYSSVCFWGKGKKGRRMARMLSDRIEDETIEKRICCDE